MFLKRIQLSLIFIFLGIFLVAYQEASAFDYSYECKHDDGAGTGCGTGWFCKGTTPSPNACRPNSSPYSVNCPSIGVKNVTGSPACTASDSCGICTSCTTGYNLCGTYPSMTCNWSRTVTGIANCSSYVQACGTVDVCNICEGGFTKCDSGSRCQTNRTNVTNCATYDQCNTPTQPCSSCTAGNALCATNDTCKADLYNCATLRVDGTNCANGLCATCKSGGYQLCTANNTNGNQYKCLAIKTCYGGQTYDPCSDMCTGTITPLKLDFNSLSSPYLINSVSTIPAITITGLSYVGIGTTNPTTTLDVASALNSSIFAGNKTISGVGMPVISSDAATKGYVDANIMPSINAASLWSGTTTSNIWNINSGNVGIGTTNPTALLDLNQNTAASTTLHIKQYGGATGVIIDTVNPGGSNVFQINNTSGQTWNQSIYINQISNAVNYSGLVAGLNIAGNFGHYGSGGEGTGVSSIVSSNNTNTTGDPTLRAGRFDAISNAAGTTAIGLHVSGSSTSGKAYGLYSSSGLNYFAGNVGIGTTDPGYKLEVSGLVGATGIQAIGAGVDADLFLNPKGNGQIVIGGGSFSYTTASSGIGSILFNNSNIDTPNIKFAYGNNLNFAIDSADSSAIFGTSQQLFRFIKQSDEADGAVIAALNNNGDLGVSGRGIFLGSVGIGTTTPATSLEIISALNSALQVGDKKISNVSIPSVNTDVATKGYVDTNISGIQSIPTYVGYTATTTTYNGNRGGYYSANQLCDSLVASSSHVCTSYEILNTINSNRAHLLPTGVAMSISNGPPAFTKNANDCLGWTSSSSADFGAIWIKLSYEGYGGLHTCDMPHAFACCK